MFGLPKKSNFQCFDPSYADSSQELVQEVKAKKRNSRIGKQSLAVLKLPTNNRAHVLRNVSVRSADDDKSQFTYSGPVLTEQPAVQFVVPSPDDSHRLATFDLGSDSESESSIEYMDDSSCEEELQAMRSPGVSPMSLPSSYRGNDQHHGGQEIGTLRNLFEDSVCAVADSRGDDSQGSSHDQCTTTQISEPSATTPHSPVSNQEVHPSLSPRRSPKKLRWKAKETGPKTPPKSPREKVDVGVASRAEGDQSNRTPRKRECKLNAPISPVNATNGSSRGCSPTLPDASVGCRAKRRSSSTLLDNEDENEHCQKQRQTRQGRQSQGRQSQKKKTMKAQSQEACMSPHKQKKLVRVNSVPNIKSPVLSSVPRSPMRTLRKFKNQNLKKATSFDDAGGSTNESTGNASKVAMKNLQSLPSLDLSSVRYQVDLNRPTPRRSKIQSVENTSGLPELNLMDFDGIAPKQQIVKGRRKSVGAVPRNLRHAGSNGTELPSIFGHDTDKVNEDSFLRVLHILDREASEGEEDVIPNHCASNNNKSTTEALKRKIQKDRLDRLNDPKNQTQKQKDKSPRHRRSSKVDCRRQLE